ncbi:hypothetical protein ALT1545_60208 [Alteromonas macleodii]
MVAQIADSFVVSLLVFEMESSLLQGPLHVLSSRLTSNILTAATNTKKDLAHVSVLTLSTILF